MQQSAPEAKLKEFIAQASGLSALKLIGSIISFPTPAKPEKNLRSVLVLSDAGRQGERGHV